MTSSRVLLPFAVLLAFTGPAAAQMYPGQGVQVNPAAVANGPVIYQGGRYVRLPPLLQPGQPYPGTVSQPIQLHMPAEHHHHAVARRHVAEPSVASVPVESEPAAPPPVEAPPPHHHAVARRHVAEPSVASAPVESKPAAPPPPRKHEAKVASAPPPEQSAPEEPAANNSANNPTAIPFSFGGPMPRQPAAVAKPKERRVESQPPAKVASIAPPPKVTAPPVASETAKPEAPSEEPSNLSKRSEIPFPHNAFDPTPETRSKLKLLADDLNSALEAGARRVQLDAFGGAPGDKSSDARRVSLRRALIIRQLLIDDGVPASRIDVRAMGGIDDHGNADRVDVYVRAS